MANNKCGTRTRNKTNNKNLTLVKCLSCDFMLINNKGSDEGTNGIDD